LLEALGMVEQFRYEKYRQTYVLGELEACLDETPIGCYIELEGAPDSIRAGADRLGLSMKDGEVRSYPEIYEDYRRRFGDAPSFMVFSDNAGKESRP
jgi:adenylate cyclase, class 2